MRLYEAELFHPGVTEALVDAHRERWTKQDEMLRLVALGLDRIWRQMVVDGGRDEPEPLEIHRPGEEPAEPKAIRDMRKMMGGGM